MKFSKPFFSPKGILSLLTFALIFAGCKTTPENNGDQLFEGFQNPHAEARPFVRWWWNGNKITKEEVSRELDILKAAGFGGVEINPIAFPEHAKDIGIESLTWMSDEWIDVFVHACQKSKENGMIADAIVGSGWPFGGEFLEREDITQRILSVEIPLKGNDIINDTEESLFRKLKARYVEENKWYKHFDAMEQDLFYIALIPTNISDTSQVIDLMNSFNRKGRLVYQIEEEGEYLLSYGFHQLGHRDVMHGAKGAAGPVMDHYKKEVTLAYLSRLKEISKKTGIPLKKLLRALFCDSIEVAGANWTDGFLSLFSKKYGYDLSPYIPFIFYKDFAGYQKEPYSKDFKSTLKKVRYDYNNLLVETFLKNFTQTFQDFCTENGLKCRYQAYGTPFLMGMLDGYMIPDIPESNNWIYSAEMDSNTWVWSQGHGYMIWNMYTAAGGHLTGKKIISCEAMTNTRGVFKTSLEEIKQHDDMNFITGINHSVLHGFNYSPPEAGFPGWIRYGAYFSEQNTWWPYISKWTNYNARLSYIFQQSQADKSIAIVGPTADLWGNNGLGRGGFHMIPGYLYKMWEPISQLGYSCEYINQNVLKNATVENGTISYGPMNYRLLVLTAIRSMHPETAKAVEKHVKSGGQVIILDSVPSQSLHYQNAEENDKMVREIFENLLKNHAGSVFQLSGPKTEDDLMHWTLEMLQKTSLKPDVKISRPDKDVYQIHQYTADKKIYFFTNVHRYNAASFKATFPVKDKYPWVWNPETGEKTGFPYGSDPSELQIELGPLESLLLIFENEKADSTIMQGKDFQHVLTIENTWEVTEKHANGESYEWKLDELIDFAESENTEMNTFAGEIIYKSTFENTGDITHINLGHVNEGITEVFINGKKAGLKWYGQAIFPIADLLHDGKNELEIRYTTVLANYCQSLKSNPTAERWANYQEKTPTGIEGPVVLLKQLVSKTGK
jgi:hypothetical protein